MVLLSAADAQPIGAEVLHGLQGYVDLLPNATAASDFYPRNAAIYTGGAVDESGELSCKGGRNRPARAETERKCVSSSNHGGDLWALCIERQS